jgi:hypothetical protein
MIRLTAEEFWPLYRDEVRRRGSVEALRSSSVWTKVAINAAKAVCLTAGLKIGNELYLDVMGYEQREAGVNFNWDLRVAFEHENTRNWQDELCKLCHVIANLRVLVAYFPMRECIERQLQEKIDLMGARATRAADCQWLFIFGPEDSRRNPVPWVAYTLDPSRRLAKLSDDSPFCPHAEYSERC